MFNTQFEKHKGFPPMCILFHCLVAAVTVESLVREGRFFSLKYENLSTTAEEDTR